MTQRIIMMVGIFGVGMVGGLAIAQMDRAPLCDSENGCFDRIAFEQCQSMKGTGKNVAMKRLADVPNAKKVPGVDDWLFVAACAESAKIPAVHFYEPEPI